jgi:hypothetical protein
VHLTLVKRTYDLAFNISVPGKTLSDISPKKNRKRECDGKNGRKHSLLLCVPVVYDPELLIWAVEVVTLPSDVFKKGITSIKYLMEKSIKGLNTRRV